MELSKSVVDVNRKNGVTLPERTVDYMYMVEVHNMYLCTSSMAE